VLLAELEGLALADGREGLVLPAGLPLAGSLKLEPDASGLMSNAAGSARLCGWPATGHAASRLPGLRVVSMLSRKSKIRITPFTFLLCSMCGDHTVAG
jgi:hypothetical protein